MDIPAFALKYENLFFIYIASEVLSCENKCVL